MSEYNNARGGGDLSLTVGYPGVFCLLGLIAAGGAVYAVAASLSGPVALAFAAFGVFALLLSRVLWVIRRPAPRGQGDSEGGGGGGGSMVPHRPGPSGGDDGLLDWVRFEHEFRAYAQRHELATRRAQLGLAKGSPGSPLARSNLPSAPSRARSLSVGDH